MAITLYNSKAIIPAPFVDIRRQVVRNEAGRLLRRFYAITITGKLTVDKGSPNSQGVFWTQPGYPPDELIPDVSRLASLRSKMKALNDLFCTSGQWFEIQPIDGSASIKFQPIIKEIAFEPGGNNIKWYNYVDYVISMEANSIWFGTQEACNALDVFPEEQWNIESADPVNRTFRLTHTISSQQRDVFDVGTGEIVDGNYGWQRARTIVLQYLGLNNSMAQATGVLNLTMQAYNYIRSQRIDEGAGHFEVTETWLLYDANELPPCIDDFTIDSKAGPNGIVVVTLSGNLTGLEVRDNTTGSVQSTRWTNVQAYYNQVIALNLLSRVSSYAGINLNPTPLSTGIGKNPVQGTISYNVEYNNRRPPTIPGAINETIVIGSRGGTDVVAKIPVLGRPWGPILQGINTITEKIITVQIDAVMKAATMDTPSPGAPNTDGVVLSFAPVASQVFREDDQGSWNKDEGRYTRNVTFTYQ